MANQKKGIILKSQNTKPTKLPLARVDAGDQVVITSTLVLYPMVERVTRVFWTNNIATHSKTKVISFKHTPHRAIMI